MPPKIIPQTISCKGCECLKERYVGLIAQGSDHYNKVEITCDHPNVDRWSNHNINDGYTTPPWCPYLIGDDK